VHMCPDTSKFLRVYEEGLSEFKHLFERAAHDASGNPLFFEHQLLAFEHGDLVLIRGEYGRVRGFDGALQKLGKVPFDLIPPDRHALGRAGTVMLAESGRSRRS
jgi:hypothetical protein